MTRERFNAFCAGLRATTHVIQWGGADVWKVGGRMFAIGSWAGGDARITFKVSELAYELLEDQPGLRPAPYLASRGLSWIQHFALPGLSAAELGDHLQASHALVTAGLPKRTRQALGLDTKR